MRKPKINDIVKVTRRDKYSVRYSQTGRVEAITNKEVCTVFRYLALTGKRCNIFRLKEVPIDVWVLFNTNPSFGVQRVEIISPVSKNGKVDLRGMINNPAFQIA